MGPKDLEVLSANASNAADLLKAMSNQNRLMILCSLMEGEMSVNELNNNVPLSQSALSQHLAALRKADLVKTRREAQTIFYSIEGDAPLQVIKTLKSIYCP